MQHNARKPTGTTTRERPEAELLTSFARLTDLVTPFAVRTAVALGLPELIDSGVTRLDELAVQTGTDRDALRRLLRHLTSQGLLAESEPGIFAVTDLSQLLLCKDENWLRAWLDLEAGARMDLAFAGMLHSIRTGEPTYAMVHGHSRW